MGDLLQRLLNEVVVTPYDPDITSRLATICDTMAEEVTVDNIDRYIASFVYSKSDKEFKQEVEERYAETYPDEGKLLLPPIFAIVLSQYITIEAITEKMGGRDQATASLKVMNYMLYRKGSLLRLILPNHIADMYYKLDDYITGEDTINIEGDQMHFEGLLSSTDYLVEHGDDDKVKKEVREMAKMAILYKRQTIIEKYRCGHKGSVYVMVYEYLYDVIEQSKWCFLKNDVKQLLCEVISDEEQKKQVTIESIVNELVKADVPLPYDILEESSLLLKYIADVKSIPDEIKNKRLTVMEFGVYVYYEILLEHIIGRYYDN